MDIIDQTDQHRFVGTEDGKEAQLVYEVDGDRLRLLHTEVPEELGGRGIGGQLVRAAVDRAAVSGETLVPLCPFAHSWLDRHPDAAERVEIEVPDQT